MSRSFLAAQAKAFDKTVIAVDGNHVVQPFPTIGDHALKPGNPTSKLTGAKALLSLKKLHM